MSNKNRLLYNVLDINDSNMMIKLICTRAHSHLINKIIITIIIYNLIYFKFFEFKISICVLVHINWVGGFRNIISKCFLWKAVKVGREIFLLMMLFL